jgi:hypothetical protein
VFINPNCPLALIKALTYQNYFQPSVYLLLEARITNSIHFKSEMEVDFISIMEPVPKFAFIIKHLD